MFDEMAESISPYVSSFNTRLLLASGGALLLVIAIVIIQDVARSRKYKFPPSPPGRLPLIGHGHLMPKQFTGDKAKEWGE